MEENRVEFIDVPKIKNPISPNRQRALIFLQNLSRRLGRRVQNDLIYNSEEDLRSSSTDSDCSNALRNSIKDFQRSSFDLSSESSDTSSSHSDSKISVVKNSSKSRISISSFSKALQNLSSTNKSLSCNSTPLKKPNTSKTKKPPQRILRQPVNYVYLKGMSGLPTRRVPRSAMCCQYAIG